MIEMDQLVEMGILFSQHDLEMLKEKGLKLFAFTNQHRISSAEASISQKGVKLFFLVN
ncbi:hypothetical protein MPH47_16450 [Psychrobacillus psychrodurans]|uniref:hypothetical protein n=1 Tax=Psychrobacillus psychrodurans TaxID=126157 RepID=UPI001F4E8B54|nr:hypothetical protein [Psychrobacillus psychrodurans]MCK1998790.1 hypothetical protein [Psychrobacillus psychrodurans]